MAIKTQIRLPQLSGSFGGANGADHVGPSRLGTQYALADIPGAGEVDGVDSVNEMLQYFADAIGKVSGFTDWTDAPAAQIRNEAGAARDLQIKQEDPGQKLILSGNQHVNVLASNEIKVHGQDNLQLRSFAGQLEAFAFSGIQLGCQDTGDVSIEAKAGKVIVLAEGGTSEITATSDQIWKAEAKGSGPQRMILSASNLDPQGSPTAGIDTSGQFLGWTRGDVAVGAEFKVRGGWGPDELINLHHENPLGVGQPKLRVSAGHNGGRLLLSGSDQYPLALEGFCFTNGDGPQQQGNDTVQMWGNDEEVTDTDGVTNVKVPVMWADKFLNTSVLGAILTNKVAISENALPTLFDFEAPDDSKTSGTAVPLSKIAGNNSNLTGAKPNSLQVSLNGQLLASGSGSTVPSGADYVISDEAASELKFDFDIRADDIIQVHMFG